MSDPFEQLRGAGTSGPGPDITKIKARARNIQKRRQYVLGSGALAIAVVAVIGTFIGTGRQVGEREAALRSSADPTAAARATTAADVAVSEAEEDTSASSSQAVGTVQPSPEVRTGGTVGAGAPVSGSMAGDALGATVEVQATSSGASRFTLKVCNPNPAGVTREFATGQRYDFEVRSGSDLVWRWSDGRAFTQVTGQEAWKASECKSWSAEWNGQTSSGLPAISGRYQVTGVLKSSPEQRTKPQSFCRNSC